MRLNDHQILHRNAAASLGNNRRSAGAAARLAMASSSASALEAPTFSSSRIVRWADCTDLEREQFAKFFAEHNVSFFRDADGSFAANIRLYDKDVLDPNGGASAAAAAKKASSPPARDVAARSAQSARACSTLAGARARSHARSPPSTRRAPRFP